MTDENDKREPLFYFLVCAFCIFGIVIVFAAPWFVEKSDADMLENVILYMNASEEEKCLILEFAVMQDKVERYDVNLTPTFTYDQMTISQTGIAGIKLYKWTNVTKMHGKDHDLAIRLQYKNWYRYAIYDGNESMCRLTPVYNMC